MQLIERIKAEKQAANESKKRKKQARMSPSSDLSQYHYCSFMPMNGRLLELDSLENHPIDHGK